MKRTGAFLLLAVMLYNMVGYYIAFQVLHVQVKQQLHSRFLNGVHRTFYEEKNVYRTAAGTLQFADDREFRFQGKLYDVLAITSEGSRWRITAISDEAEQQLLAGLERSVTEQQGEPAQHAKQVIKSMAKDYFPAEPMHMQIPAQQVQLAFVQVSQYFQDWIGELPPQPPQHYQA